MPKINSESARSSRKCQSMVLDFVSLDEMIYSPKSIKLKTEWFWICIYGKPQKASLMYISLFPVHK